MKTVKRKACSISGQEDLDNLYVFKSVPVFMGCVDSPVQDDLFQDMSWSISNSSGAIQLDSLVPLEILYKESHGSGDIGSLWENHHKCFADFIFNFNPSSVFEIGGGHGRLSDIYKELQEIPWTIVEPNPTPQENNTANFIEGFFDSEFTDDGKYDTYVHSHVFEHLYNQDEFMRDLSNFTKPGDKLIFTLPNMEEMLKRKYTNCLNFEHTVFLTEPYIEYLLAKHGFRLIEKEYFMEDHSIFYASIRDLDQKPINISSELYNQNKEAFFSYVQFHKKLILDLNSKIRQFNGPVYLFGAHVFAQVLIQMGLDVSNIDCILDNDPNKQGKRLYGTSLMVNSPKILEGVNDAKVILKAGIYNAEIKKDILHNINASTVFLE